MSDNHETRLRRLVNPDPGHFYSEDELDAIEALDPQLALRLDRAQTLAAREVDSTDAQSDAPVNPADVAEAVAEARRILMQDGGDIELIAVAGRTVRVRLKGACVGCPRAVLDLRNVVERLIKSRAPGVRDVLNTF